MAITKRDFFGLTGALLLTACQKTSPAFNGKTVYIVHGYMASPKDHWFEWLKDRVEEQGGKAHIISMPDSADPDRNKWTQTLIAQLTELNEDSFIVAHSLGCLSTLRFLDQLETKIGGLILVSGFEDKLPVIPSLDSFISPAGFRPEKIKKTVPRRAVFASDNDTIVDPSLTKKLARSIDASFYEVKGGGHFLSSEGYTSFQNLLSELRVQVTG